MTKSATDVPFLSNGGTMGNALQAYPWDRHEMGPAATWPRSLQTALGIMLRAHYPINVYWGPRHTNFYNDAYLPIIGTKHPEALGRPLKTVWPEVWDSIEPLLEAVLGRGESFYSEDVQQFVTRSGFVEEIFMSFSYSPLYGDDGEIGGVFAAGTEVTAGVIGRRRLRLLGELGPRARADRPEEAARDMAAVLGAHREDVPFAVLCLPGARPGSWSVAATSGWGASGDAGRSSGDAATAPGSGGGRGEAQRRPAPPAQLTLSEPLARRLEDTGRLVVAPAELGLVAPAGPWDETPERAVVTVLRERPDAEPVGLLVAGVSARRPLDDSYRDFFSLLGEQVGHGLANAAALAAERRRKDELEQLNRAKTNFLASVSHEFRTPLTLILGPLGGLLEGRLPDGERDTLEQVRDNALRLRRLVDNLLEYSRIQAGRMEPTFAPEDLPKRTATLAALFESAFDQAGIALHIETEPFAEPVFVDAEMWDHVVSNLVSNALKFSREGSVTVRLFADGDRATLEVVDTGVGIPADQQPHVFDPFYHRATEASVRTKEGAGVGLALSRELVELHGGTVEVDSEPGRGTRFTVRVPFGRAHLDPARVTDVGDGAAERDGVAPVDRDCAAGQDRVADLERAARRDGVRPAERETARPYVAEAKRWLGEGDRGPATGARRKGRVMVVDDHPGMREYFRSVLEPELAVETAGGAEEAEALLAESAPDCVVLDVMMPEVDGVSFLRRLRARETTARLPVILVSARSDRASRVEGLDAGADDYLVKPFDPEELRARVRRQLESVTAQMRRERTLREAAEKASEAKSTFLANMSHEIRTPIASILLAAGVLEERADTGLQRFAANIRRSGERLTRMLDAVLMLSRLEAGEEVARLAPLRPHDVAGEVVEALRPLAEAGVTLELEATSEGRAACAALDAGAFTSVVQNLLGNALKFTHEGRVTVRIDTGPAEGAAAQAPDAPASGGGPERAGSGGPTDQAGSGGPTDQAGSDGPTDQAGSGGRVGGTVRLHVEDTGVGIEADYLGRLFEMFSQEREGWSREYEGAGVGLALTRRLVSAMGGRIEVESEKGRGSRFTVSFPRIRAEEDAPDERTRAAGTARGRILVVEDQDDARELVVEILSLEHDVEGARDGEAALRVASERPFDLLLLDVQMPGLGGDEVMRRLRSDPRYAETPMCAVTAFALPGDQERLLEAGFDAYLSKPYSAEQLRALVQQLLEARAA